MNLDPGGRGNRALYTAAQRDVDEGDVALVERAADALRTASVDGGRVLLTTGFPVHPDMRPETDGPPGALVLARAVERLGGQPVVAVEPPLEVVVEQLSEVLEVDVDVEVVHPEAEEDELSDLFHRLSPDAVAAVEKPGCTQDGSYRSMSAEDVSSEVYPVDRLMEMASDVDVPTVAVGDGGNEVGMGGVHATVEEEIPRGPDISCVTPVDHLVVAGVSNWGAYGVAARLSLAADVDLLHTPSMERELIQRAVDAGCVDGKTGLAETSVDGLSRELHASMVELLGNLVEEAST